MDLVKKADLSSTDVKIGDEIEVEVVKVNDGEGNVLLSQTQHRQPQELGRDRGQV